MDSDDDEIEAMRTAVLAQIDGFVEDPGWAVQVVGATGASEDTMPTWAYTIGLWASYLHPDLVIVGLPPLMAGQILNNLGTRVSGGEEFVPGQRLDDVIEGITDDETLSVELVTVSKTLEPAYLGVGLAWHGGRGLHHPTWLQVVWPDKHGQMPWDPGFSPDLAAMQPQLGTRHRP